MSLLWKTAIDDSGYYHGTIHPFEPGSHVLPADHHDGDVAHPMVTDRSHAYATPNVEHAWDYAEKAWHGADPDLHIDFGGPPRVYRVRPLGPTEKDPEEYPEGSPERASGYRSRGNWSTDVRSKHGFEVLHEVPMPEHMGDPEDWR